MEFANKHYIETTKLLINEKQTTHNEIQID